MRSLASDLNTDERNCKVGNWGAPAVVRRCALPLDCASGVAILTRHLGQHGFRARGTVRMARGHCPNAESFVSASAPKFS